MPHMTDDIFNCVQHPNLEKFKSRGLQDDPRLGEVLLSAESCYESSKIVLVGCPQDIGVKRNGGRPGASEAPDQIRESFYKFTCFETFDPQFFCDIGNLDVSGTLEEIHQRLESLVSLLIKDKKKVIVLGGGNDISYANVRALKKVHTNFSAINIDAHFDVRPGKERHSGTPYRWLLEERTLDPLKFYEIGWQSQVNSKEHYDWLEKKGCHLFSLEDLRSEGVVKRLTLILETYYQEKIFWGFDMDAVRASDAPGVSAPSPIGLFAEEAVAIAGIAGSDPESQIFEITEVNPTYDLDGRTCRLAALQCYEFLKSALS